MIRTYVPLGHGSEITQLTNNGTKDYVIQTIPPNCFYITMAISGETNRMIAHRIFFNMMKQKDIRNLFVDIISNFSKIKRIFDDRIPDEFKDSIKLNLRLPGETYVDVKYTLFLDFKGDNVIYKAGLYDLSYITTNYDEFRTPITKFNSRGEMLKDKIQKIYNHSIIPSNEYFNALIGEFESKTVPIQKIKDTLKFWPFYSDYMHKGMSRIHIANNGKQTIKPTSFKYALEQFATFINSLHPRGSHTAGIQSPRPQYIGVAGHNMDDYNINNNDIVEREGPVLIQELIDLLNHSDTNATYITYFQTYYQYMIKLFKRIYELSNEEFNISDHNELFKQLESEGLYEEMKEVVRNHNKRVDKPQLHLSQSYLFANRPGIYINMACRSLPEDFPEVRKVARRRNSNASRLRYNRNNIHPELNKYIKSLRPSLNEENEGRTGGGAGGNSNNRVTRKNRRFFGGLSCHKRRKMHTK